MAGANDLIFVKGNEAIAMGALDAGCRCFFGYPITPQNDIPEFMSKAIIDAGGEFVQAESEVAAANMLLGAGSCGIRAMTSSSSPGMSLKQEAISYMAGSEIPAVIVNMNRGGPGLGDIGPSQGDYFQSTRGGGHGDYRLLVLAPSSGQEAYDMTHKAFDLAFAYRSPVLILGDAIIGQMKEPIRRRELTLAAPDEGAAWRLEGTTAGLPAGAQPKAHRIIKSLYLMDGELAGQNKMLQAKYEQWKKLVEFETFEVKDAELVVVAFGSIGRIAKTAVRSQRKKGKKVGLFRPKTLYPFPEKALAKLAKEGKKFLTIEHNLGQMVEDVRLSLCGLATSEFFSIYPGNLPVPDDFDEPIARALGQ